MKCIKATFLTATTILILQAANAAVFTIGGIQFDDANSTKTAAIVAGPKSLKIQNSGFGKYSEAYLKDASTRVNEFASFDRANSVGCQLQPARASSKTTAKAVTLASGSSGERSILELAWGSEGLRNQSGDDLVVYATPAAEPIAVSVLKVGESQFSPAIVLSARSHDATHDVSAFVFDLRDFSIADGELVRAIRIQNVLSAANTEKVNSAPGQGVLVSASEPAYANASPILKNETSAAAQNLTAGIVYVAALRDIEPLDKNAAALVPGMVTLGGFNFNPSNSVTRAFIVEGPANLKVRPSGLFAPRTNPRRGSLLDKTFTPATFDRAQTVGQLLRNNSNSRGSRVGAMHVMFPDVESAPPTPNVDRCAIELNWDGGTLPNKPGSDFVVYEVDHWEGFAVSVQKAGETQWTHYRYQFTNSCDIANVVNALAFDLSSFGVRENESISALRIRNLFNSKAASGADKVDNVTGQGKVLTSKDSNYRSGFPLLMKANGKEFPSDLLDADIVYVVGLHDVQKPNSNVAVNP